MRLLILALLAILLFAAEASAQCSNGSCSSFAGRRVFVQRPVVRAYQQQPVRRVFVQRGPVRRLLGWRR